MVMSHFKAGPKRNRGVGPQILHTKRNASLDEALEMLYHTKTSRQRNRDKKVPVKMPTFSWDKEK